MFILISCGPFEKYKELNNTVKELNDRVKELDGKLEILEKENKELKIIKKKVETKAKDFKNYIIYTAILGVGIFVVSKVSGLIFKITQRGK